MLAGSRRSVGPAAGRGAVRAGLVRSAPRNKQDAPPGTKREASKPVNKDLGPQAADADEGAGRSNDELAKLLRWASDLGSKAQQALTELQRSVGKLDIEAAQPGPSVSDTMRKLRDVSDAVAESNAAFDAAIAGTNGNGAAPAAGAGAAAAAATGALAAAAAVAAAASVDAENEAAAPGAAGDATPSPALSVLPAGEAVAGAGAAAAAPQGAPTGSIKVALAVTRETQLGQGVWVVGSAGALGAWDLNKALPLEWTEGHVWRASIEVDPSEAATIEYKAVLKNGDGSAIWESGDNKVADLAAAADAELALAHSFAA